MAKPNGLQICLHRTESALSGSAEARNHPKFNHEQGQVYVHTKVEHGSDFTKPEAKEAFWEDVSRQPS